MSIKEIFMSDKFRFAVFLSLFGWMMLAVYSAGSKKHEVPKIQSKKLAYVTTAEQLKLETGKHKLVLVDFYADWCGPCLELAPNLVRLADNHEGKVRVVKVNVDEATALTEQFKINSIPALFIIKDGEVISQEIGYKSYNELVKLIDL